MDPFRKSSLHGFNAINFLQCISPFVLDIWLIAIEKPIEGQAIWDPQRPLRLYSIIAFLCVFFWRSVSQSSSSFGSFPPPSLLRIFLLLYFLFPSVFVSSSCLQKHWTFSFGEFVKEASARSAINGEKSGNFAVKLDSVRRCALRRDCGALRRATAARRVASCDFSASRRVTAARRDAITTQFSVALSVDLRSWRGLTMTMLFLCLLGSDKIRLSIGNAK